MTRRKPRRYTAEFKEQAVQMAHEQGLTRAARHLGISGVSLYKWKEKKKSGEPLKSTHSNIPYNSSKESPENELKRLRKENEELKKVNIILKKAAAFFSQDHLK